MLVKKRKRFVLKLSLEQKRKIMTWWKVVGFFAVITMITYIVFTILKMSNMISSIAFAIPSCITVCIGVRIIYSSSTKSYKVFCMLIQERRVIFQYILLGILFYIDNFYLEVSAAGIFFPIFMTMYTSFDFIGGFFPRRLSIAVMAIISIILIFNIFNQTFLKTDCEERKLKWGIYGEEISYCTIKRIIYQTILSLLTPAFLATLTGQTNNLFFCNANIYRSSGTINRKTVNVNYVRNMSREQKSSESRPSHVEEEDIKSPDDDDKKEDGMIEKALRIVATAAIGV